MVGEINVAANKIKSLQINMLLSPKHSKVTSQLPMKNSKVLVSKCRFNGMASPSSKVQPKQYN